MFKHMQCDCLHTSIDLLLAVQNPPVNFLHDIINNATRSTGMGRLTSLVTIKHLIHKHIVFSKLHQKLKHSYKAPSSMSCHVNRLGGPQQRKRDGVVSKGQLDIERRARNRLSFQTSLLL